jgi:hypothetical protein
MRPREFADGLYRSGRRSARYAAEMGLSKAHDAYERGAAYAGRAAEYYPHLERTARSTLSRVYRKGAENPLMLLLATAGLGLFIAAMVRMDDDTEGAES